MEFLQTKRRNKATLETDLRTFEDYLDQLPALQVLILFMNQTWADDRFNKVLIL